MKQIKIARKGNDIKEKKWKKRKWSEIKTKKLGVTFNFIMWFQTIKLLEKKLNFDFSVSLKVLVQCILDLDSIRLEIMLQTLDIEITDER
jgi:hypothetical protein